MDEARLSHSLPWTPKGQPWLWPSPLCWPEGLPLSPPPTPCLGWEAGFVLPQSRCPQTTGIAFLGHRGPPDAPQASSAQDSGPRCEAVRLE
ncbi:hypothetical protein CapIbe_016885 [Capra ibex]